MSSCGECSMIRPVVSNEYRVLISFIYIIHFYSTSISVVFPADLLRDQTVIEPKKPRYRNTRRHSSSHGMFLDRNTPPIFSNYFPVLTGIFRISTRYHRLFTGGGHVIVHNVSARSARGETEPITGRYEWENARSHFRTAD